jgi:hypothetical protein
MIPILSLLLVLTLSILVTRVATVILTHTGLSRQSARFQARSAFTGVGFTTEESEKMVNHPVRRRILLVLMLLGNAGIVTAMASLIVTMINLEGERNFTVRLAVLVCGVTLLMSLTYSKWLDVKMSHFIDWALKRYTDLELKDYAGILHLGGEYRVSEMYVNPGDWLAGKRLGEVRLKDEGILALGITRQDGTFIGAPDGGTRIEPHDSIVLYGRTDVFEELDRRSKGVVGDWEHVESVAEQKRATEEQIMHDPAEEKPTGDPNAAGEDE